MRDPNGATSSIRPYAILITILSVLARLVPHAPNFTPVGSASLFAGARIPRWPAFLIPLVVMAITDPLVGGYTPGTLLIYLSFLVNVWIGRSLRRTNSPLRIGGAALLCSVQFFLISNFGPFLEFYPHTLAGLAACYTGAIPFFGYTVAGDLVYSAAIFGLHYLLTRAVAPQERALASA